MKTKQEIEKMADDVEFQIKDTQSRIAKSLCGEVDMSITALHDTKRHLITQYYTLLEVLK